MKKVFLLLVLNFTIFSFIFSQGLQLATQEQLENYEVWVDDKRGFTGELPSSFTMEKYCPPVMKQIGSSCVGWSIYAAMSTMYNVLGNHTHTYQKLALAFDPYFIYVSLRKGYEEDCHQPMYMQDAMEFMPKMTKLMNKTSGANVASSIFVPAFGISGFDYVGMFTGATSDMAKLMDSVRSGAMPKAMAKAGMQPAATCVNDLHQSHLMIQQQQ